MRAGPVHVEIIAQRPDGRARRTTIDGAMAGKIWILDTETKGTGANVVPLEKIQRRAPAEPERPHVPPAPRPKPAPEPAPREPHRFKVTDLMTREVLAEDVDARATVDILAGVRSIVDVNLYVWRPDRRDWRLLPLEDKRALWQFRSRPE